MNMISLRWQDLVTVLLHLMLLMLTSRIRTLQASIAIAETYLSRYAYDAHSYLSRCAHIPKANVPGERSCLICKYALRHVVRSNDGVIRDGLVSVVGAANCEC